jgi:hypothetical protein
MAARPTAAAASTSSASTDGTMRSTCGARRRRACRSTRGDSIAAPESTARGTWAVGAAASGCARAVPRSSSSGTNGTCGRSGSVCSAGGTSRAPPIGGAEAGRTINSCPLDGTSEGSGARAAGAATGERLWTTNAGVSSGAAGASAEGAAAGGAAGASTTGAGVSTTVVGAAATGAGVSTGAAAGATTGCAAGAGISAGGAGAGTSTGGGVGRGAATGAAATGRNASGSRYPCGFPASRMPRCT